MSRLSIANWKLDFFPLVFTKIGLVMMMAGIGCSWAQTVPTPIAGSGYSLPEAMIVPIKTRGRADITAGWVLLYRNKLLGLQVPNVAVDGRTVILHPGAEGETTGLITWKITRTRNDSCAGATIQPCADRIEILSVPEGYRAFPESAWVNEENGIQIFIVPAGIG